MATRGRMANLSSIPLIFMGGWSGIHGEANLMPIGFLSFAREYELAADRLAVQTIAGAGYDPRSLVAYVSRLQPEASSEVKQRFSALPALETRISNLQDAIDALPERRYASSNEFALVRSEIGRMIRPVRYGPSLRPSTER
jgi:predicted Zn-dependent protease